jgi:peroxiredoxin
MRFVSHLVLAVLIASSSSVLSAKDLVPERSSVGRSIEEFQLQDFRGRHVSLDDFSDKRAVVIGFLGTDCPLAKFYGPRLQLLSEGYQARDVAFIGINPNRQDSLAEMEAYARRHKITFPMLKDPGSKIADRLGATRAPEVFVLDAQQVVRYQGRVDGTFTFGSGVGLAKPQEGRADLATAIDELLNEKPVSVPYTEPKGCLIGRARQAQEHPTVTYGKEISRIIQNNCLECHRNGQVAPFALDNYEEVAGWGEMIAEVVREQRMPPWHGVGPRGRMKNDARLSDEEKQLIQRWVDEGCPQGDLANLPEERKFHEGWFTDGGPDDVFYISEQPVSVKAEGVEEYRYYEIDLGFKEDKWVSLAECMPGNRAVVHHIIAYARPPGGDPIPPGSTGIDSSEYKFLVGFAPGTRPLPAPEGWARLLPADHSLVVEMHYTPIGTKQMDRSCIGLVYTDPKDVTHVIRTQAASNHEFEIPPKTANYRVESDHRFKRDTVVLSLFPHMHLRGKSFRFELVSAGGNRETLLDVPHYDFNWQNYYVFAEPRTIAKGSKLECTAYFDNSDENLANPDPSRKIRWGPQSWDEMMIGFFDIGIPKEEFRR